MINKVAHSGIIILLSCLIFVNCKNNNQQSSSSFSTVKGMTMGTYYAVKYQSDIDYSRSIDSILLDMNNSMSTYIDSSYISQINNNHTLDFSISDPLFVSFMDVFSEAKRLYKESNGYYDASILPLVEFYGFGSSGRKNNINADSLFLLMQSIGMDKVDIEISDHLAHIKKDNPKLKLDFSSIAKGYAVDQIANYLSSKGIKNMLVDIGGEQILKGVNQQNIPWRIGINLPDENANYSEAILFLGLSDKALASSGNYRNYYEIDGKKYSHTINPKSGLSEDTDLLAVSVITNTCSAADAIATACMSMGLEKSKHFIENQQNVEACLFYLYQDSIVHHYSTDFNQFIIQNTSN